MKAEEVLCIFMKANRDRINKINMVLDIHRRSKIFRKLILSKFK